MLLEKEFIEPIVPLHFYMIVKGSYLPNNAASRETSVEYAQEKYRGRERERKLEKRKDSRCIILTNSTWHKLLMLPNPFPTEI